MTMKIVRTPPTTPTACFYCPPTIDPPRPVHAVAQLQLDEGTVAICQSCLDHLDSGGSSVANSLESVARRELRRSRQ
jgi:hypothetical protein